MGVDVQVSGSLVARTGIQRAHIAVPEEATVEDVVRQLSRLYGTQVRRALLEDGHLRSDTRSIRGQPPAEEPVSLHSEVEQGDTLRFEPNR